MTPDTIFVGAVIVSALVLALVARLAARRAPEPDEIDVARGPVAEWREAFLRRPEQAYERARRVVESVVRARYHVSAREAIALVREGRLALDPALVALLAGRRPPLAELAPALEALA